MKTFEDFREHHQKDAHGRVVEHGDGTPSSVEEAVGAVAGGAAKVALGGAALAGKAAVKGAKFAGKAAAYLGKKAGNRIGKELVKATSDVDNNADKEFDKVKVKRYKETPVKEDYYRGTGEKVVARTQKWMKKKGQKGAPGLDAMKARTAEHEAKRGVKEENALERRAKENEKARKWLKKDAKDSGYTDIALKASMSKGAGVREEVVSELNRYGKETGKATGSLNKRAGTPVKRGGGSDKALNFVRNMIRKETGKPEGQQKKVKGEKGRVQYGDRKVSPSTTIAKRRQAAKDADAAMRDTRGT